ncbi:hypothetical protein [Kitasatospora sp. NPDC088134]|uniref:hypothetical protein n=1 Tax=Kitasatospora sp. NPDC088134 TaxID=3364071 RepID=UPI003812F548
MAAVVVAAAVVVPAGAEQPGPGCGAALAPPGVGVVDPGQHGVDGEPDVLRQHVQEGLGDGVVAVAEPDRAGRLQRGQPPAERGLGDRGHRPGGGLRGVPELQVAAVLLAVVQGAAGGHHRPVQPDALDPLGEFGRFGVLRLPGRGRRGRLVGGGGGGRLLGEHGGVHPVVAEQRRVDGGAAEGGGDGGQRSRPPAGRHAEPVADAAVGHQQVGDGGGVQRGGGLGQVGEPGLRVQQVVADRGQPAVVAGQRRVGGGEFVLTAAARVDRCGGGCRRGGQQAAGPQRAPGEPSYRLGDRPPDHHYTPTTPILR